jgi:hypothetical protein
MSLSDKVNSLEEIKDSLEKQKETLETSRPFRFPFRWALKFMQSKRKSKQEMALVLFFNKKNEIEQPMFLPIFSGNMIVYKNKAYEFDPRAIWRIRGVRGYPSVYCIREIDRRPIKNPDGSFKRYEGKVVYRRDAAISNMDIDEVRARGDSTESDEFLIKAALKAQTTQIPVKGSWLIGGLVVLVIIGIIVWLFVSK